MVEGNYTEGVEDGFWIYYDPPGFIKEEGHYKLGKKDGLWKIMGGGYTPYLAEHINYKDGKKDGENYEWYIDGTPKKEVAAAIAGTIFLLKDTFLTRSRF